MKNQKVTCINVETISFDNQTATFENEEVKVTVQIKDQLKFGAFEKGKEYPISFSAKK